MSTADRTDPAPPTARDLLVHGMAAALESARLAVAQLERENTRTAGAR